MEEAPQSGNGEEGKGSSLDREGKEVERKLLEGEGSLDEGEWGDVGRQLDVEMGREVDELEGVACAPGPTADLTSKQLFEELQK